MKKILTFLAAAALTVMSTAINVLSSDDNAVISAVTPELYGFCYEAFTENTASLMSLETVNDAAYEKILAELKKQSEEIIQRICFSLHLSKNFWKKQYTTSTPVPRSDALPPN